MQKNVSSGQTAQGASWPALMSPTKSTAASRAAKPRATPSSPSANANDTVIDLCDDLSPVRSNTRRGVPFPAHIQGDKSAAALAGNRKRLLSPVNRQHGSSTAMRTSASPAQAAQSSIAPMHASARGPQMDLTGKSKQDAVSYHQQLSAVAGHQWKESNQLHKRHRAHALVADTIQGPASASQRQPTSLQQLAPLQQLQEQTSGAHVSPAQHTGLIDLVGVTEAYCGAIQAADQRADIASSDSALAQARAETADLKRQLQELLASKQVSLPHQPLRAPMPSHWTPMPEAVQVSYVELPLPPGCSPVTGNQTVVPKLPPMDEGTLQAMMQQGLNRSDAEAALRHCDGDGDAALMHAVECMSKGGATAYAEQAQALNPLSGDAFAQAAAEQARQEADLQEAHQVLARFTASKSYVTLSNVLRIERVQNPHLWTKYCLRRHEIELAAGSASINEQLLFHGCRKDIMAVITQEGFDMRLAGMQGSLGAGTYFAGNSRYSMGYTDRGPGMMPGAGVGMASMPNAFAAGGWPPGMPAGWPPGAVGTNLRPSGPGVPMSRSTAANPAAGAAAGAAGADPNGRLNSIFPHPSSQGVGRSNNHAGKSSKKKRGRSQPPDAPLTQDSSSSSNNASQPGFLADAKAMMLCRVALGRLAVGGAGLRLPPRGHDAVTCAGGTAYPNASSNVDPIFAVFDNSQAYPEYVIHFRPQ